MTNKLWAPGTVIDSPWLNDANTSVYSALTAIGGTANAITATGPLAFAFGVGNGLRFAPTATNTGPVTINVNGLGTKAITKFGATPLVAGELASGTWASIVYDGTQFQLLNAQGPRTGFDTYVTTAGSTLAYTLTFGGSFALFSGTAVKLIFNATNTTTTPSLNVNGSGAIAMKVMDANGNKIDPIVGVFAINTPATVFYDGVNWVVIVEYPTGRLLNVQTFTANGTYTPTPGTASVVVEAVGGGGAGGGAAITAAAQVSAGSGGGSGSYTRGRFIAPGSQAVTVGAGGAGVSGASGNFGLVSSFGALLTSPGGFGGNTSPAGGLARAGGGAGGGTGTGGNIVLSTGNTGDTLYNIQPFGFGSNGATSIFGSGGTGGAVANGGNASGFGSGGGGAANDASIGTAKTGGNGSNGIVIIYEYS